MYDYIYAFEYAVIVTLWHTVHIFSPYSECYLCFKSTSESSQIDYFQQFWDPETHICSFSAMYFVFWGKEKY